MSLAGFLLAASAPAQVPEPPAPVPLSSAALPDSPQPQNQLPAVFEKPLLFVLAPPSLPPAPPEPRHRLRYMISDGDPDSLYRLTRKEKFLLSLHHSVDFEGHGGNIFLSSIQQAADTQPHYKQGWDGYGQRILAAEAYKASSTIITVGILSSLMKTDPRFIRLGRGSFRERMWYAAKRTVVARRDSGGSTFNLPFVLGQLLAGAVAVSYSPDQDRNAAAVFQGWGLHLAYSSGFNCLREFSPFLIRLLIHHRVRERNSIALEPPPSPGTPPARP